MKNSTYDYPYSEKKLKMNCKWCNREIEIGEFCNCTCKEKFNKYETKIQKNIKWFWLLIICCFILYTVIRDIVPLNIIPLNIDSACFAGVIGLIIIIFPFQSKKKIKKVGALRAIKTGRIIGSTLIGFAVIALFIFPH